jgi:septum formation protein
LTGTRRRSGWRYYFFPGIRCYGIILLFSIKHTKIMTHNDAYAVAQAQHASIFPRFVSCLIMIKPVILASNSPRRRELLEQVGLTFTTDPADVDESILPNEDAEAYAVRVALDKARVVAGRVEKGIIIAADTIVVLGDTVLGKPADVRDAGRMLGMLSGRMHRVISGLAIVDADTGRTLTGSAITLVWFRDLTPAEIRSYVATGEPLDKAGAYGIQAKGALLVKKLEGCYFNVVGLPLSLLEDMLGEFDITLL